MGSKIIVSLVTLCLQGIGGYLIFYTSFSGPWPHIGVGIVWGVTIGYFIYLYVLNKCRIKDCSSEGE